MNSKKEQFLETVEKYLKNYEESQDNFNKNANSLNPQDTQDKLSEMLFWARKLISYIPELKKMVCEGDQYEKDRDTLMLKLNALINEHEELKEKHEELKGRVSVQAIQKPTSVAIIQQLKKELASAKETINAQEDAKIKLEERIKNINSEANEREKLAAELEATKKAAKIIAEEHVKLERNYRKATIISDAMINYVDQLMEDEQSKK